MSGEVRPVDDMRVGSKYCDEAKSRVLWDMKAFKAAGFRRTYS